MNDVFLSRNCIQQITLIWHWDEVIQSWGNIDIGCKFNSATREGDVATGGWCKHHYNSM